MSVEDVIQIQAEHGFLHAHLLQWQRIAQADICGGVGGQRTVLVLGVVQILPTHIARVPHGLQAFVVHVDETVENGRWRERQRGVVVVELAQLVAVAVAVIFSGICISFPVVPVLHKLVEVSDLVLAQRSVAFQRQPWRQVPAGSQFHAHAVGVLDVGGQVLADVALLTRLNKLVVVVHVVEIHAGAERLRRVVVAKFEVHQLFGHRRGIVAVVGEVVALRLPVAQCHRGKGVVAALVEAEAGLRVQEVILLVYVEHVFLVEPGLRVVDELVVVSVGLVAHVAILHVGKCVPLLVDVERGFHECTSVQFLCVAVVILVVAVFHEQAAQLVVAHIGGIAEVVAVKLLHRQTADNVPVLVVVAEVPYQSVGILAQPFLAHPVGSLHSVERVAVHVGIGQAQLLDLVLWAEFIVVAVAVGVVQRGGGAPAFAQVPCTGQDVVVLPEVVGGFGPVGAVVHRVSLCLVVSAGVLHEVAVGIGSQLFVERVVAPESHIVEVVVGLDARLSAVGAVHQAQVVVAGRHAVPCLSRLLEVADVLESYAEVVADPRQSAIIAARASACAVYISVGVGLMIGTVDDEMVPQESRGERPSRVERVV